MLWYIKVENANLALDFDDVVGETIDIKCCVAY